MLTMGSVTNVFVAVKTMTLVMPLNLTINMFHGLLMVVAGIVATTIEIQHMYGCHR